MLGKLNVLDVLRECGDSDDSACDNVYDDNILSNLQGEYDDIEEIPGDINYDDDMVNVVVMNNIDESCGFKYVVEMDNLQKLMEAKGVDAATALERVAEVNELNVEEFAILVESDDEIETALDEVKGCGKDSKTGKKKIKQVKETYDFLKNLKNKGIKVVKKKSSGKKKK